MRLLQMSFSGAVFIIAVVMLRAAAVNRLPKRTFLILWELVLFKLLVPFSVPSVFSIDTLIRHGMSVPAFSGNDTVHAVSPVWPGSPAAGPGTKQPSPADPQTVPVWLIVWCVGMILFALFFTVSYVRCLIVFQASLPVDHDAVAQWPKKHPIRRPVSVRQSDRIFSPLTYGVFRPVILMPKHTDWTNERQLQYILAHEQVHICRYDSVTKLIAAAALCIHWFNPMVWIMYSLFDRDMELSCDESVIQQFGQASKSEYARMLIGMEARKSGLQPFCSNFSKNFMEERITAIMKNKKTTIFSRALACLIIAAAVTVFATSAQANERKSPESAASARSNAGSVSPAEQDRMRNAAADKILPDEATVLSYVDPLDGQTYYCIDGGETYMTEEEYEWLFPTPDVTWWTYEEYAAWLENEKVQLQGMIGETGWTGGRGEFVWTQEIVDETIAMYEEMLQEILNGRLISKSVNGSTDIQLSYDPADLELSIESAEADEIW